METLIAIVIIFCIIGLAIHKIYKDKQRGVKCVGCPSGKNDCNCDH